MAANYPTIVRKFQPHSDGTEYVLAGHMNDVQDEVAAVEATLGTKPHVHSPTSGAPTVYSSVGARLDAMQQTDSTQQTQVNSLLDASKTGFALPLLSVVATGTSIGPTGNWLLPLPSDWHPLHWSQRIVDTEGSFSPGSNIVIPKTGWWTMTSTIGMVDPSDAVNIEHYLWARIRVSTSIAPGQLVNIDLGQGDSSANGRAGGFHRITMAISGDFYLGDTVQVQLRHVFRPTDPNQPSPTQVAMTATSRTQLTYIRGLPANSSRNGNPIWQQLPYEIGT